MSSDDDVKARILGHMNRDHQRSLALYLEAFCAVPARAAASARLTAVSLTELTLTAAGQTHSMPLSPPAGSLADLRPRLIALDAAARTHLGLSRTRISAYTAPRGAAALVFFLVATYYLQWATLGWVEQHARGSAWCALWQAVFPGGWAGYAWTVRAIVGPVLAVHVVEMAVFAHTRLRRHDVARGSGVWWAWMMSVFFEGFPAFLRFDGLVRAAEEEAAGKH